MNRHLRYVRSILPPGLDVAHVAGRHIYRVIHADTREPLRHESGMPVVVPSTPSDNRSLRNFLAEVKRAQRGL